MTNELHAGWRKVKFGDVVRQTKEDVDPENSDLDRYVAGEHMETDNLHIRRWGNVGDGYLGPAFHRRFVPGQVLYGSRRTYLRKVAYAEFEGICANTTFVLEPHDSSVLLPELLPFIMQTETFHAYSISQSRGSVNPYINFRDIASYEFPLPPLDEQRRIAEILWAADEAVENWRNVLKETQQLYNCVANQVFPVVNGTKSNEASSWITLGDLLQVQVGYPFKSSEFMGNGIRLLRGANLGVEYFDWNPDNTMCWPEDRVAEVEEFLVDTGDIVIGMDRPFVSEGFKIARLSDDDAPALLVQRVGRFILSKSIDANYLWAFLHSSAFMNHLVKNQQGTDIPHISKFDIESAPLVELSIDDQQSASSKFTSIETALTLAGRQLQAASRLSQALLQNHLG